MADDSKDVVIRISAKNLTKKEFDAARKQLDDLGKKAGFTKGSVSELGKGFEKAAKDLASFNPTAARASSLLGGFGAAGLAAGAGIGALTAAVGFSVRELVVMGDRLSNLSRITGITTDALQRMEAFGRPIGISLEQMTSASTKLEKSLGEGGKGVTEALKRLGLSMGELARMDADKRLLTVAQALARLDSPLQQAAAGSALLGKSWSDLRLDAKSIDEGTKALEDLVVVSKEALDAGDSLGDSWDKLWVNLKNTAVNNAGAIAQALNSIVEAANSALISFNETNAQIEQNRAIQLEMQRLAGGPFKLQGLVSGGASTAQQLASLRAQAEQNIRITQRVAAIQKKADEDRLAAQKKVGASEEENEKAREEGAKAAKKHYEERIKILETALKLEQQGLEKTKRLYESIEQAMMRAVVARRTVAEVVPNLGLVPDLGGSRFPGFGRNMGPGTGIAPSVDFSSFGKTTEEAAKDLKNFGLSLDDASDLAQIFGDQLGPFGDALIQGAAAADLLTRSFKEGTKDINDWGQALVGIAAGALSVANATGSGSTGSRVAGGALSGASAGAAFGPWGAAIGGAAGAITGLIRGLGGPDIGRDVGRDIGANISEELEKAIEESGENAQMFLREIFEEGGLGIDRLAEEVGDLFSFFERGEISESGLLGELEELLPILIENFGDLGETGKAQIDRIINAAAEMGVELGAAGDALERLAAGIPEITLEGFAEELGISVEKARELAEFLGVPIQTELERMADDLDIPVEKLQELGAAMEEQFGVGVEGIQVILDQLGISIEELAERLNVDLPAAADAAAGAAAEGAAGAGIDPTQIGDSAGERIAKHLEPGQFAMASGIALQTQVMQALPAFLEQAMRNAVAGLGGGITVDDLENNTNGARTRTQQALGIG